jgi:hypothetical protein
MMKNSGTGMKLPYRYFNKMNIISTITNIKTSPEASFSEIEAEDLKRKVFLAKLKQNDVYNLYYLYFTLILSVFKSITFLSPLLMYIVVRYLREQFFSNLSAISAS